MAYTAPTVAQFQARFATFGAVEDLTIQGALDRAARMVDESWTEGDFAEARMQLAAHYLTIDGFGTGAAAEINAQGLHGVSEIKSGSFNVKFADGGGAAASGVPAEYAGTPYGLSFWRLLKLNQGGPRTTAPAAGASIRCCW